MGNPEHLNRIHALARAAAIVGGFAFPCLAHAQSTMDASALVHKVQDYYRAASPARFVGVLIQEGTVGGQTQRGEANFVVAAAPGRKFRWEVHNPQQGVVITSDGDSTWTYLSQYQQYVVVPAPPDSAPPGQSPTADATPLGALRRLADIARDPKFLRTDSVMVGGISRPCYVVELLDSSAKPPQGLSHVDPGTYYIGQDIPVVWKLMSSASRDSGAAGPSARFSQTLLVTSGGPDATLPDSTFSYSAPEGAKRVVQFRPPERPGPDYLGKAAMDFTLKDTRGKLWTLSKLKGKVVIVDFWATWCGPCKMSLPHLNKVARELAPKGLVTLAVNVAEPLEKVKAFMVKNSYTFNCLLDSNNQIALTYGASSIPMTIVVDRKGVVADVIVGWGGPDRLRAALMKAGI